jgi:hypothetical protein
MTGPKTEIQHRMTLQIRDLPLPAVRILSLLGTTMNQGLYFISINS